MVKTNLNKGYVTQIIGPVLDIKFPEGELPPIYSALKIALEILSMLKLSIDPFRFLISPIEVSIVELSIIISPQRVRC